MTIEQIIRRVEAQEIDDAVDFLIHLDKDNIPKDVYYDLSKSLESILIPNSFDECIKSKLDGLLEFLRDNQ